MSKLQELEEKVIKGKMKLVPGLVKEALDEGNDATVILNTMIGAMDVVGENFTKGDIFVTEMLISARAMKAGVDVLKPLLAEAGGNSAGKVIIGTVAGDLHDIGKNLVAMMIESAGFEVIDLGVDVPHQKFVDVYLENPDTKIIALSALLTTTMPSLKDAVALLNKQSFRKDIKVMVGGAPITAEFAAEIGADAYTADAASAAAKAKELAA